MKSHYLFKARRPLLPFVAGSILTLLASGTVHSASTTQSNGTIQAINTLLDGVGIVFGRVTDDNSPPRTATALRLEPSTVRIPPTGDLMVKHSVEIYEPGAATTQPWAVVSSYSIAGSGSAWNFDLQKMPDNGILIHAAGSAWSLQTSSAGLILGPAPFGNLPTEEIAYDFEPGGEEPAPILYAKGTVKWFNDSGVNRLLALQRRWAQQAEGFPVGVPSVGRSRSKGTGGRHTDWEVWNSVNVEAALDAEDSPLAIVRVAPANPSDILTFTLLDFATEASGPVQFSVYVPEAPAAGMPPESPCILDLHVGADGTGGALALSDGSQNYALVWSGAAVVLTPVP